MAFSVYAHRGYGTPENIVKAFKQAYNSGFDGVELDVRKTGDGELVVFHDSELDSKTDSKGVICELPTEHVTSARVKGSNQTVPRLEEVLEEVPESMNIITEIKETGIAQQLLEELEKHDHGYTVSSFHLSELQTLSEYDVETGYLFDERKLNRLFCMLPLKVSEIFYLPENIEKILEETRKADVDQLHARKEVIAGTDLIKRTNREGTEVVPWTLPNRKEYGLLEDKVEKTISNILPPRV